MSRSTKASEGGRPSEPKKTLLARIQDGFWLWVAYLSMAAMPLLLSVFFIDGISVKLDKKMTCTVSSTRVFSETYSIGNGNGSANGVLIESPDCPELMFTDMPDGVVGTNDLQRRLEPGHRYTFVYAYIKLPMDTMKVYSFSEV